jgi:hypothetical protein
MADRGYILTDGTLYYVAYHKEQHILFKEKNKLLVYQYRDTRLNEPVVDEKGRVKHCLKSIEGLSVVGFID